MICFIFCFSAFWQNAKQVSVRVLCKRKQGRTFAKFSHKTKVVILCIAFMFGEVFEKNEKKRLEYIEGMCDAPQENLPDAWSLRHPCLLGLPPTPRESLLALI